MTFLVWGHYGPFASLPQRRDLHFPVFFKNGCVTYTNILHFEQTFFLTLNLNSYWKYTVKEQKLKDRVWKKKLSYPLRGNETLRWWDFTSRNLPSLATSWPHKFRVLLSQQREVGVRDKVKGLFRKSRSSSRALRSVMLESFTIVL